MSQENVEIIRRSYEVQDDADQVLSLFDPNVVVTNLAGAPATTPSIAPRGAGWRTAQVGDRFLATRYY